MRLEVAKLRELLAALVQLTEVRFLPAVDDFVCSDVAMLREGLAADVAVVRSFACVSSFVRFEVSELGEALVTGWVFAYEGLRCQQLVVSWTCCRRCLP